MFLKIKNSFILSYIHTHTHTHTHTHHILFQKRDEPKEKEEDHTA